MATRTTAKPATRDVAAEVAFLTRALKAPTLRESVTRLAERARAESWSHEEFLIACLQPEVSTRESHGGEGRIRAARFPAPKSLDGSRDDALLSDRPVPGDSGCCPDLDAVAGTGAMLDRRSLSGVVCAWHWAEARRSRAVVERGSAEGNPCS
jgi:hypothetical protein